MPGGSGRSGDCVHSGRRTPGAGENALPGEWTLSSAAGASIAAVSTANAQKGVVASEGLEPPTKGL